MTALRIDPQRLEGLQVGNLVLRSLREHDHAQLDAWSELARMEAAEHTEILHQAPSVLADLKTARLRGNSVVMICGPDDEPVGVFAFSEGGYLNFVYKPRTDRWRGVMVGVLVAAEEILNVWFTAGDPVSRSGRLLWNGCGRDAPSRKCGIARLPLCPR